MSSHYNPWCPLHFLVLHADPLTTPSGSSCQAGVPEASSTFGTVSADEGPREAEPSTSAKGAESCDGDRPARKGWLGTAANTRHGKDFGVDSDGPYNAQSEEQGCCRPSSLVRMRLYPETALPPALNSNKCAADILKEVWHCPETLALLAGEAQSTHEHDVSKRGTKASVSPTELDDLIHELVNIGFASAQEQKLLQTSPLAAWARILPSVTTRYCQRRYALNVNNHERADYMLCRHQNGLVMLGLAPTHYILEEARRRRKSLRCEMGSALAGYYSLATNGHYKHSQSALAATADENPLLQEDEGGACMNPVTLVTEQRSSAASQCKDSDSGSRRISGPLLKVEFKQQPLECTASGKRKRGGAQLHVRIRLGTISVHEPFSTAVNAPSERSASDGGVAVTTGKSTCHAPIFGCITGELLEVNEALDADADLLLEPPEKGGWLFIAKPAKKLASHSFPPFCLHAKVTDSSYLLPMTRQRKYFQMPHTLTAQGWGIFVDEQEAFASRPHLLSFQEKL
ncbi:hypothetical protein Esti_005606 [Eimeria stiedai]